MRSNFKALLFLGATLLAFSCKKEPVTPETVMEPEAPVIVSAQLKGTAGEDQVLVGSAVKFTAKVTVKNSELASWDLTVKKGDQVIGTATGSLSKTEANISREINLTLDAATLTEAFYPEVTFAVKNKDDQSAEKTLAQADNVQITIPQLLDAIFLVDNNGKLFQMDPVKDKKGVYRTKADLSEIGTSFTIAEKVTGTAVDPSGRTWEYDTPVTVYNEEELGLRWIGFDLLNEELSKMVDLTITFDGNKMSYDASATAPFYVFWQRALVQDCEVEFLNYPQGLKLQADWFDDVDGNLARFIGNSSNKYEIWYCPDVEWFIIKYQWSDVQGHFLTGKNASLPMEPFIEGHPLDNFNTSPNSASAYSAPSLVRLDETHWKSILYLEDGFYLKLYAEWAWASELDWTSGSPDLLVVTERKENPETGKVEGNLGVQGDAFKPGLYTLIYDEVTYEATLTPYTGTLPVLTEGVEYIPSTDPTPDPGPSDLYVVDDAGTAFGMEKIGDNMFRTKDQTSGISSSFVLVEKYADGEIDWSGKVYGIKDGEVAEIEEGGDFITLPQNAYLQYNQRPKYVAFDTANKEVVYWEIISKNAADDPDVSTHVTDYKNGYDIKRWTQPMAHNSMVMFKNYDKPVSQMVNLAIFEDVDDEAMTARYIGMDRTYELYANYQCGWICFDRIGLDPEACDEYLIIGKNASFPQEPYTDYPIRDDGFKPGGNYLSLSPIAEGVYVSYVYLADDFSLNLYSNINWGSYIKDWTSATPDLLSVKDDGTLHYGTQNVEKSFEPGVYLLTYNKNEGTMSLTK